MENIVELLDKEVYNILCEKGFEQRFSNNKNQSRNKYVDYFYAVHVLEAEVLNGGFDQFFRNGGFDFYVDDALLGLQHIGGLAYKSLLSNAIKIHLDASDNFSSKRNPKYNILDDKFYNYNKYQDDGLTTLNKLQVDFIRKNIELFG